MSPSDQFMAAYVVAAVMFLFLYYFLAKSRLKIVLLYFSMEY